MSSSLKLLEPPCDITINDQPTPCVMTALLIIPTFVKNINLDLLLKCEAYDHQDLSCVIVSTPFNEPTLISVFSMSNRDQYCLKYQTEWRLRTRTVGKLMRLEYH